MLKDFNTFKFGSGIEKNDSDELSDDDEGGAEPKDSSNSQKGEDYFVGHL